MMKIKDVKLLSDKLVLTKPTEVDKMEQTLWATFPDGYQDYITKLGEGTLGGCFVRIYPPRRILEELEPWRKRVSKYWLWDKGKKVLPKERAVECILIGDSMNGDELVFHPSRPGHLFVLPRHKQTIYEAGTDLLGAVDWMCSSGKLTKAFKEREFEPFDSRKEAPKAAGVESAEQELEKFGNSVKQYVKRRGLDKQVKKKLKEYADKDKKVELLYECLYLKRPEAWFGGISYGAAWLIHHKKSGKLYGTYESSINDDGQSASKFNLA